MSKLLNSTLLPEDSNGVLTSKVKLANELFHSDPKKSADILIEVILSSNESEDIDGEDPQKVKEAAIYLLGDLYVLEKNAGAILTLFEKIRSFFNTIPKAKTAKIVRNFIDLIAQIEGAADIQETLCLKTIEWCLLEKRTFLRHRIETRLALLYYQMKSYVRGLKLIDKLLHEVKRLDDKLLLIEIYFIESKLYFSVRNIPKSKAALTAARSNANAIHCPPLLQADIDVLAGALHLEENDSKTAYSYFFEAFEAFNVAGSPKARIALKYMMLSKIMSNQTDEVLTLSRQKQYVKYAGREVECFKVIATSYKNRDLKLFEGALHDFRQELYDDPVIERHTTALYQNLLEQNILKILEPFSRVEVSHVAKLIELPSDRIQSKLGEMILDKKLFGTLDQGDGILLIFDEPPVPTIYKDGIEVFENLSNVVDLLYKKSQKVL